VGGLGPGPPGPPLNPALDTDILAKIVARMSVSAPWNASFTARIGDGRMQQLGYSDGRRQYGPNYPSIT